MDVCVINCILFLLYGSLIIIHFDHNTWIKTDIHLPSTLFKVLAISKISPFFIDAEILNFLIMLSCDSKITYMEYIPLQRIGEGKTGTLLLPERVL